MKNESLQAAYRGLLERRAARAAPDIDVDVLQALAEGSVPEADRDELLDRVLAHPETAREYRFLSEIARGRPKGVNRSSYWLIAATLTAVLFSATVIVQRIRQPYVEAMRSGATTPVLLEPGPDAGIGVGTGFVWHAFPAASSYRIELIDEGGSIITAGETRDTTWAVPAGTAVPAGARLVWWVTAMLADGTERRASPRTATGR